MSTINNISSIKQRHDYQQQKGSETNGSIASNSQSSGNLFDTTGSVASLGSSNNIFDTNHHKKELNSETAGSIATGTRLNLAA